MQERRAIIVTTLKEIAQLAGVSRGTVDRVLNNRGAVKPETARRVREIAISLNYQPNKAALALASQKKKITIGVLLFGINNGNLFFEDVVEGVEYQRARLAGYGCTVITRRTVFDPKAQLAAIDEFLTLGIHGLVISPHNSLEIIEKINQLSQMGIPTITTNTDRFQAPCLCRQQLLRRRLHGCGTDEPNHPGNRKCGNYYRLPTDPLPFSADQRLYGYLKRPLSRDSCAGY